MAHGVQDERRVFCVQERGRIGRVGQRQHAALRRGRLQPVPGGLQCVGKSVGRPQQRLGLRLAHHLAQRAQALAKNLLGQAKGGEQFARRCVANACGELQAQPVRQFVLFQQGGHGRAVKGTRLKVGGDEN